MRRSQGMMAVLLAIGCVLLSGCESSKRPVTVDDWPQPVYAVRPAWVDGLPGPSGDRTGGARPVTSVTTPAVGARVRSLAAMRDPLATLETAALDGPLRQGETVFGDDAAPVAELPEGASLIEQLYFEGSGISAGRALRQFGYDVLTGATVTPQTGPLSPDYLIGAGDTIMLRMSGAREDEFRVEVERDGTIFIKEIGTVQVAGLAARALTATVAKAVAGKLQGVETTATVADVRGIRVAVMGRVGTPGLLMLPANATLLDALALAGGPRRDGSLRRVTLRRGESAETIDLYEMLAHGRNVADRVLLAGDTIHVPAIGATAAVLGPAGSGIFEITDGATVASVVALAGNVNAFTRQGAVRWESQSADGERRLQTSRYAAIADRPVGDGDVLALERQQGGSRNAVMLGGQVLQPGVYAWEDGLRVSDLLRLGGGYLLDAALDAALLERQVADAAGTQTQLIWVDLRRILSGDGAADLPLQPLDRLRILARSERQADASVVVIGAVRRPGSYRLTEGLSLGDLLQLAGGPTADAFAGDSTIVRRRLANDGQHFDVDLIAFPLAEVMAGGDAAAVAIHPSDEVVVRRIHELQVSVKVDGQVHFPGTYVLPSGSRISDAIIAAGGVLPDADMRATMFTRVAIRELQNRRLEQMFEETRQRLARNRDVVTRDGRVQESVASQLNLLGLAKLAQATENFQATGRVVLDFMNQDFPASADNLTLEKNDEIVIPRRQNAVIVLGEVFSPNAFVWRESYSVGDYLRLSGGLKEFASPEQTYVVMASGEVRSAAQVGFDELLAFKPGPGDTLLVPVVKLDRSSRAAFSDALSLLRELVELGLIGATIPRANERGAAVGLDLGTSPQPIPTSVGRPYDEMLDDERQKERESK